MDILTRIIFISYYVFSNSMGIVSDNYNRPAGLEPSSQPIIQDTGAVIHAWTPMEHQHKSHLYIPTVAPHVSAPFLDVYISVNPNVDKYIKYIDQIPETSTLINDLTVNEYINQQNNVWVDDSDISHKNIDHRQVQPGPVQFLKGSQKPHGKSHKSSGTLPKLYSYFYRGYINPSHNNNFNSFNGGQHQSHNCSIEQVHKIYEHYQPPNYPLRHIQTGYYDGISRNYQKNTWPGKDTYQNISSNRDIGPGEMKPDGVLLNTYDAYSHQLSLPMYALKVYKTPKETPEIHINPLYRPNLKNNIAHPNERIETTVKYAQDIINHPELYPDIKKKKKKNKFKKTKLGTLEKVMVEQKNLDDLVEQRDDLSQEIWEQNFINLGKERNIGQGHEKKSNSKEQSEEVPTIWDLNINQLNGNPKGSQWHNHIENLNVSLQNLKNHKQAVEEYIYANTRSIPLHENNVKRQRKNFSRVTRKRKAGDTKAIELAYLKEIQGTTKQPPAEKPSERARSPLWNAMESYYTFAKDIIVSWFD